MRPVPLPSRRATVVLAGLAALALTAPLLAGPTAAAPGQGRGPGKDQHRGVALSVLGTYASGVFGESAAEITDFDPRTRRAFVVNAQRGEVDVLDARDPRRPRQVGTIAAAGVRAADGSTITAGAVVNSVSVHDGLLALAVESDPKTDRGWVVLAEARSLRRLAAVRVGVQPDMVTFAERGRTLVTADEGEPADDFSVDPAGSVSVVDVRDALRGRRSAVRTATFDAWDRGRRLPDGVRVFGPDVPAPSGQGSPGRVARNLEPEYVATSGSKAWVSLQEADAVAVVDLDRATVRDVLPMPRKSWAAGADVLDASDRDGAIDLRSWPVRAVLQPDGIHAYSARGRTYLVTANEGDAREWGDYVEGARIKSLRLCPDAFPDAATLQRDENLGRLEVSTAAGPTAAGCYARLDAFGGRSFSVLDDRGRLVFDSAGLIEQTVARLVAEGDLPRAAFNATNDENDTFDDRSDNKGPEPEGVEIGQVGSRTYAFVGLERISGILVYDVTDPRKPVFQQLATHRDFEVDAESPEAGDLGPEGLHFVPASDSPTRSPLLIVGNEVSGTATFWEVDTVRRR